MSDIQGRISEYLCLGGLFNPELMPADKVRDLIMACNDEIERLRGGLQLIAGDKNRLMNEVARQTAASILGGKPIGEVAEWPKRDATSAQLAEAQRFSHSAPAGCNHFPGQVNCEWCTEPERATQPVEPKP